MRDRSLAALVGGLGAIVLVLIVTASGGVFTIDDGNYIASLSALRAGSVFVPGTENLPPSPELAWFDPLARNRGRETSLVSSTAPPLFAVVAFLPSYLGWRGVVALNCIAWAGAAVAAFLVARRLSANPRTPWVAAFCTAAASPTLEYAQGYWPHALAMAFTTAAFGTALLAAAGGGAGWALAAGFSAGIATGFRYQNVIVAVALLGILAVRSRMRIRTVTLFAAGLSVPLLACSLINNARGIGWNPISKHRGYLALESGRYMASPVVEGAAVLWTRVVDYSAHPPPPNPATASPWQFPTATGTYVHFTVFKKAWLQSCPWVVAAFVAVAAAVRTPARRKADFLSIGFVMAAVLGTVAAAGFSRYDGVCFNQRYLLELMPLAAIAFALALDGEEIRRLPFLSGALAAVLPLPWIQSIGYTDVVRARFEMYWPLAIAVALLGARIVPRSPAVWRAAAAGAAMTYALAIHVGEDFRTSRLVRRYKAAARDELAAILAPGSKSLVMAAGGSLEPYAPLVLDHDLVLADVAADGATDASSIVTAAIADGRRVLLVASEMPRPLLRLTARGRRWRLVSSAGSEIYEAGPAS